jgi:hypothetical protein
VSRRLEEIVDAILFVGEEHTSAPIAPDLCADTAYVKMRLDRIAVIGLPQEEADRVRRSCYVSSYAARMHRLSGVEDIHGTLPSRRRRPRGLPFDGLDVLVPEGCIVGVGRELRHIGDGAVDDDGILRHRHACPSASHKGSRLPRRREVNPSPAPATVLR